jgi:hypothetical protein
VPEYHRIYALAAEAMPSTEAKLSVLRQPEWTFHVDHVIAVVSEESKRLPVSGRNRSGVFSSLSIDQVMPLWE